MNGLYLKMRFSQCYISAHVQKARNGDHRELSPLLFGRQNYWYSAADWILFDRMMSQNQ